jgi:hypothetical protein
MTSPLCRCPTDNRNASLLVPLKPFSLRAGFEALPLPGRSFSVDAKQICEENQTRSELVNHNDNPELVEIKGALAELRIQQKEAKEADPGHFNDVRVKIDTAEFNRGVFRRRFVPSMCRSVKDASGAARRTIPQM